MCTNINHKIQNVVCADFPSNWLEHRYVAARCCKWTRSWSKQIQNKYQTCIRTNTPITNVRITQHQIATTCIYNISIHPAGSVCCATDAYAVRNASKRGKRQIVRNLRTIPIKEQREGVKWKGDKVLPLRSWRIS